jgi:hypothetical protein
MDLRACGLKNSWLDNTIFMNGFSSYFRVISLAQSKQLH